MKRTIPKTINPLTWSELWLHFKKRLLAKPISSCFVEVHQYLPCGCPNPEWDQAWFEEVIVEGKNPFTISNCIRK